MFMDIGLNIVKILVFPNLICTYGNFKQIPANYFVDINKLILKFIWKDKRPRVANTTLKYKVEEDNITCLQDSLTYSKDSMVMVKEIQVSGKNRVQK